MILIGRRSRKIDDMHGKDADTIHCRINVCYLRDASAIS